MTPAALAPSQRRALAVVLVVAAGVRLAWALYATEEPIDPFVTGDPWFYFRYGQDLAAGDGYVNALTGHPTAYYPIGYPALLAGLFWVVEHTPLPDALPMAASLLHVALGTASVALVFVIARRLFDPAVALVAAALAALFPNLVFYVATMQLETAFIFLSLAAVAVLVTTDWRSAPPSRARLVAFGAVLGASALVRPFSVPFLLVLLATGLVGGLGWRWSLSALGWSTLALAVVVSPWLVRNQLTLGSPVFTTNMGDTVCIDRYVGSDGEFRFIGQGGCDLASRPSARRSPDFEVSSNDRNTRRAVRFVLEHPGEEARLVLQRAQLMWESDHDGLVAVEGGDANPFLGDRLRTVLRTVADWYFWVASALAVVGLVALGRGRRPERLFALGVVLTLLLVPLALWGNTRFHVPVLPLLALLAAVPLARLPWPRGGRRPHLRRAA